MSYEIIPTFSYTFSTEELKKLIIFLRKNEETMPEELTQMKHTLEYQLYSTLSIDEAERLFNEKN